MDAITFLLKEHGNIRLSFAEINNKSHSFETKRKMLMNLCQSLVRHETMEQGIWYPFLKKNKGLAEKIKHLISEEKKAEKAMKEFTNITTQSEWEEKFSKFHKDVDHHATEEEEKLFPSVKKVFTDVELEDIGSEMIKFTKKHHDAIAKSEFDIESTSL